MTMCNTDLIVFGARMVAFIGYGFGLFCLVVAIMAGGTGIFRKQSKEDRKNDIDVCVGGLGLAFGSAMLTAVCLKLLG
jgi:hypothetical protein